ncbi:MAG: glycosyl hydrolase family 28 protein [Fimbriimonadaceae bacterium]
MSTAEMPYPGGVPSSDYRAWIDGAEVFVHDFDIGSAILTEFTRPCELRVRPAFPFARCIARPLSKGLRPDVHGGEAVLRLDRPAKLSIEFDDRTRQPLFLMAPGPESDRPDRTDPNVLWFESGKRHEPGLIELRSGQTLYIESGALVRGQIRAWEATGVRIGGRGVFERAETTQNTDRTIALLGCDNVRVDGITVVRSRNWTIVPAGCRSVRIHDVNVLSGNGGDDGIDVVGSVDVEIDGVFIRTKDDCIAVKALDNLHPRGGERVRDVLVRDSTFWNAEWGNALEIGYETRASEIRGITFRNCDVIRCEHEGWSSGGTFTIHNGDRAEVGDVLYEDIRVEDSREKLFDFKVCFDQYSRDSERGSIRNVTARDIRVVGGPFPPSILQGYDKDHMLQDIAFERVTVHGQPFADKLSARMVAEKTRNLQFRPD